MKEKEVNADVVSVHPNKVCVAVKNLSYFALAGEKLSVGSYLRISDSEDCAIIAIIDNFSIESPKDANGERRHLVEATPIGFLGHDRRFIRGGNNIAIPPTKVEPAKRSEIQAIHEQIDKKKRFAFAALAQDSKIKVPVDGDRFFSKHIAIVGSTGSGKSNTLACLLQKAVATKDGEYKGLNNSHVILLDVHGEYARALPSARVLDAGLLWLPYWLMNGEELEELLVDSREHQAHNQVSLFRRLVTRNKILKSGRDTMSFDTPTCFSIDEVLRALINLNNETVSSKTPGQVAFVEESENGVFRTDEDKFDKYFVKEYYFKETKPQHVTNGAFRNDLDKLISRLRAKISDRRLGFLFGSEAESHALEELLMCLFSYENKKQSNVTIIDLSGIPFEVLSITVSLISRLAFDFVYHQKKLERPSEAKVPFLLVYEEAHKYVPRGQGSRYNACRSSIERIAKEGRKYGITLVIVSQRPSEISETIFSQCNNFIAMRLTNPEDQNYVKRLLPDSLGSLTEALPSLGPGEALLIGDAVVMPSWVSIERCSPEPSSSDVNYLEEWQKPWATVNFPAITRSWIKSDG